MIGDQTGLTTEQIDKDAPFGGRAVIDGAALQVMPLPASGALTIGRSSKCDVVIDSGSGNSRELRNACERAVLLATGATIDLPRKRDE